MGREREGGEEEGLKREEKDIMSFGKLSIIV